MTTYKQLETESWEYDFHTFKVILVGDCCVGKTTFLRQYNDDIFVDDYMPTIGVDFGSVIDSSNYRHRYQIWDTAGNEMPAMRMIIKSYISGGDAIFILYSVIRRETFESIPYWINFIKQCRVNNSKPYLTYLVANKCDLSDMRIVTQNEGMKLAKSYEIEYLELSCKNRNEVSDCFKGLGGEILKYRRSKGYKEEEMKIDENCLKCQKFCVVL